MNTLAEPQDTYEQMDSALGLCPQRNFCTILGNEQDPDMLAFKVCVYRCARSSHRDAFFAPILT